MVFKKRTVIAALITIILGAVAFSLGPIIWPPAMGVMPTSQQLPFYVFLSILEALLFGFGIALAYLAIPYLRRVGGEAKRRTIAAFISIVWILISWWPHDNLHMHIGLDLARLLGIEYGFHLTLMIAGIIISYYFFKEIKISTLVKK